ncbi:MAG: response regulator of citrate/malate metabolism [Crocinitomicaceae bacterium]|jgi:response regulator of citrate/malate metabolism
MAIEKIVVVEDDMIIQMFIARVLQTAGFKVVGEARKCSQVLIIVEETKPDLILMDIGLSGDKDGIETAEILMEKFDIPIIFITGNSDAYTLNRAKKVNPVGIIFKPIDENQLRERIINFRDERA